MSRVDFNRYAADFCFDNNDLKALLQRHVLQQEPASGKEKERHRAIVKFSSR